MAFMPAATATVLRHEVLCRRDPFDRLVLNENPRFKPLLGRRPNRNGAKRVRGGPIQRLE